MGQRTKVHAGLQAPSLSQVSQVFQSLCQHAALLTSSTTVNVSSSQTYLILLITLLFQLSSLCPPSVSSPFPSFSCSLCSLYALSSLLYSCFSHGQAQSAGYIESVTSSLCSGHFWMPLAVLCLILTIKSFPLTIPWSSRAISLYGLCTFDMQHILYTYNLQQTNHISSADQSHMASSFCIKQRVSWARLTDRRKGKTRSQI